VLFTRFQLHTLILIGFGAIIDLPSDNWFGLFPESLHIHIIDSSRPYNLSTLFGAGPAERIVVWDDDSVAKMDDVRASWFAIEVKCLCLFDVSILLFQVRTGTRFRRV
jgi:cell division control protein 45